MSLSKNNLDKLANLIKNKKLSNDHQKSSANNNYFNNSSNSETPSEIFYSLIKNSETLCETSQINHLLRNRENDLNNLKSNDPQYSRYLTTEDELYDEFNYLLDEY